MHVHKAIRLAAPVAALGLAGLGLAIPAGAATPSSTTTYQANLQPLNHQHASGSFTLQLNGNTATITEHTQGLAATFQNGPFPHVQHIHGLAKGTCPTQADDDNGDGVVSIPEAADVYGQIQTTLSVKGSTAPSAGTNVKIAPSGSGYTYNRTIQLNQNTMKAIRNGNAVIVVHGLDPSLISKQAQNEKSKVVPSLPLAATAAALCGPLTASQMSSIPGGAPNTGGGSTSGIEDEGLLALGGGLLLAAGGALGLRRRFARNS